MEQAWGSLAAGLKPAARGPRGGHRWLVAAGATAAAAIAVGAVLWYAVDRGGGAGGPDDAGPIAAGQVAAAPPRPTAIDDAAPLSPADAAVASPVASPPPTAPAATSRRAAQKRPAIPAARHPAEQPTPDPRCNRDRFARILKEDAPPMPEVREALKDLKDCHGRKLIGDDDYDRIQTGLISHL
jgi:hypothetical protein